MSANEPKIKVGIMTVPEVKFSLMGGYHLGDMSVDGRQVATYVDGAISWQGNTYQELLFLPDGENSVIELEEVTIGVNFHWERKETQRFQGALKLIIEHGGITAVNILGVEDYLLSVISSEMSATASLELLKAHAVISRSWLLAQIDKNKRIVDAGEQYSAVEKATEDEMIKWYDREDHINFDVCADDHCQRYQGITRASTETVRQAIAATRGQVLMYDGQLCDARFSKCCGGVYEEFENCWEPVHYHYLEARRDGENETDFPDLTVEENAHEWIMSRPEAFCNTADAEILSQVLNNYDQETTDFYRWKVTYGQDELSKLAFNRSGIDFGNIVDLVTIARGTSGRLYKLKIVGTKKTLTIGKELEIRRTLSTSHLYSSAFVVEKGEADANGLPSTFTLYGAGWGHGVGLCQIGAAVMGAKGYPYDKILLHYFVDADIEKMY